jgi:hypothetical protein
MIGSIAGLAGCVLLAGGITYALTTGSGQSAVAGNFIGAGHLRISVNGGQTSDLDFSNLSPGQSETADQVITGDMAGVGAAALALTLSGANAGSLTGQTSLTISYSDPEPATAIDWNGGVCTPSDGYVHQVSYASLAALDASSVSALGTFTGKDDALCVRFQLGLSSAAGNDVEGVSASFAMDYTLEQLSASTP